MQDSIAIALGHGLDVDDLAGDARGRRRGSIVDRTFDANRVLARSLGLNSRSWRCGLVDVFEVISETADVGSPLEIE